MRHSAAHVLATAVLELFPETKLGHGPATDSGFFYDFYREKPFTEEDLAAIEKKMAEVVARDEKFVREYEPREQALEEFERDGDFMKTHFVTRFTEPGSKVSFYRNGKFVDFCRGPHVPSTGRVKAVKVMSLSGAYWLGDEKNPQLQRIYGTAFFAKKDLDDYLARLEEAPSAAITAGWVKSSSCSPSRRLAGAGLPLLAAQGRHRPPAAGRQSSRNAWDAATSMSTRRMMRRSICTALRPLGAFYEGHVSRPWTWRPSIVLRPMNCPHHILIYEANSPQAIAICRCAWPSSAPCTATSARARISGLRRVRCMTLNDAHIFCTPDQIKEEFSGVMTRGARLPRSSASPSTAIGSRCAIPQQGEVRRLTTPCGSWANASCAKPWTPRH